MLAIADFGKTTFLEWVLFELPYLKITAKKVLVSFLLAFCFQVLIFESSSRSYTDIFLHSVLKIGRTPKNLSVFLWLALILNETHPLM